MELTNKQLRQIKNLAKEIEKVSVKYKEILKTMQFNDLALKQQEDFFINELDIRALENLLQDKLNIPVTLTKTVELAEESSTGIPTLYITSQNLKDQCGILGQSFKTIILSTFGKAYFYISEEDGKQHLLMPDLYFQYDFNNGCSNGHKAFKLNYDMENKEWSIE